MTQRKWWENAIIYQIYPRSFKDTDGDGIGDIKGILEKLDYVESLGVNTIWINPMTLSAQEDKGYDAMDYKSIDPLFGTEEEVDRLIDEIHRRDMKIIYDFPLNHTSDQHFWFKEALKSKENPYRDYYIWTKKEEENRPYPTNWTAAFGGSAWSKELNGDEYYLHLFMKQMPDVNWDHAPLRKEMAEVLNYWIERGIDGFRLDAFIYIDVDKGFPEHPDEYGQGQDLNEHGEKIQDYLAELNERIHHNEKEVFIMGEATSADIETTNWYTDPEKNMIDKIITMQYFPEQSDEVDDSVPEGKQHAPLDFVEFKKVQQQFQEQQNEHGGPLLFWSNHDMPRSPEKFGDMENYRDNTAKMMATMLYLQKGIPIIYYGEEIGMKNSRFQDPANIEDAGVMEFYEKARKVGWHHQRIMDHLNLTARDVSRGIMQWENTDKVGFSEAAPWTIYNQEAVYNVREQEENENSILHYYRNLLSLKRTDLFQYGSYQLIETNDSMYAYTRKTASKEAAVYSNFSKETQSISLENDWTDDQIALQNDGNQLEGKILNLAPYGTVVFVK